MFVEVRIFLESKTPLVLVTAEVPNSYQASLGFTSDSRNNNDHRSALTVDNGGMLVGRGLAVWLHWTARVRERCRE